MSNAQPTGTVISRRERRKRKRGRKRDRRKERGEGGGGGGRKTKRKERNKEKKKGQTDADRKTERKRIVGIRVNHHDDSLPIFPFASALSGNRPIIPNYSLYSLITLVIIQFAI